MPQKRWGTQQSIAVQMEQKEEMHTLKRMYTSIYINIIFIIVKYW